MINRKNKKIVMRVLFVGLLTLMVGCNTYDVRALNYDPEMKQVTVIQNPKVLVADFVNVLEDAFADRGIKVKYGPSNYSAAPGEYTVDYSARQSWDFTTYLSDANVNVRKDNALLGRGHYHHIGGSCSYSLFKWQGTKKKMTPLYDELFKNYDSKARE